MKVYIVRPALWIRAMATTALTMAATAAALHARTEGSGGAGMLAPPVIAVPGLDTVVVEATEKVTEKQWIAGRTGDKNEPNATPDWLNQRIAAGDIKAAILKADNARKTLGNASRLADAAVLDSLYDKGMAAGLADAFLAKARLESEREQAPEAIRLLKEASRRGSAAADLELARLSAGNPGAKGDEAPLTLLNRAAYRGNGAAALELAVALKTGRWQIDASHAIDCPPLADEALAWMERASLLGEAPADFWLGLHHMDSATGLTDPARERALRHLLKIRRENGHLKEPISGKTFAELEAEGRLEPGLLAELKRREAEIAALARGRAKPSGPASRTVFGASQKRYIDHQVLEIVGDAAGRVPIYNLVGLSPYKEIAGEGEVVFITDRAIIPSNLPELKDVSGWRIELSAEGGRIESFPITGIDVPGKSVGVDRPLPTDLPSNVRYRVVRHHTLFSTFGADNRAGFKPGVTPASSDEVTIFDSVSRTRKQVFFHAERRQWMDSVSGEAVVADWEIPPTGALLIKRSEPGSLSVQVRGMRPEENLRFTPSAGVSLISTRKNAFASSVQVTSGKNGAPPAADELLVLTRGRGKEAAGWAVDRNAKKSKWWSDVGLEAASRVNVVAGSAAVAVRE